MLVVTLPDGSKREFDAPVRVLDVAQSIGSGLAKAALGGIVDGKMVDASFVIDKDSQLAIITDKSPEALCRSSFLSRFCTNQPQTTRKARSYFPHAQSHKTTGRPSSRSRARLTCAKLLSLHQKGRRRAHDKINISNHGAKDLQVSLSSTRHKLIP